MANYECTYRTNYFRVTDEEKYKEIMEKLRKGSNYLMDFTTKDGTHGFGGEGGLGYYDEETDDWDPDYWMEELKDILHPEDACILMESGNEKLRYVVGYAMIITSKEVKCINLREEAMKVARELLGDPNWDTQLEY